MKKLKEINIFLILGSILFLSANFITNPTEFAHSVKFFKYEIQENGKTFLRNIPGNNQITQDLPPINPPQGAILSLGGFMDYITNGGNLNNLRISSDTVIAGNTYIDSIDIGPGQNDGPSIRIKYNYTTNSGATWILNTAAVMSGNRKSRYPDLSFVPVNNMKTLVSTGRLFSIPSDLPNMFPGGSYDSIFGASNPLINFRSDVTDRELHSDYRADNKIGCIFQQDDSILYVTYDPSNSSTPFTNPGLLFVTSSNNTVCSYTLTASKTSNHMTAAYEFINEPGSGGDNYRSVRIQTSTDNGLNWSTPIKFGFNASNPNILGGDSCQAYWHEDIAYKPGTNTPYVVYSTYPYVWKNGTTQIADEENKGWKICIQSSALNGGNEVVIADWHNIEILSNPALYNQIVKFQVNSALLSHPSIGFSNDGNTIWVAYSVIQKDTCSGFTKTFNYFDIYISRSTNGGLNWTTPVNVTNTPGQDEMYPTLSPYNNTLDEYHLLYHWNLAPGSHAFIDGQTVTKVYPVYLKGNLIGIQQISGELPQYAELLQNYPNPFNPATTIKFKIHKRQVYTSKVYELTGKLVAVIFSKEFNPGTYSFNFENLSLSSGVYIYTLETKNNGLIDAKKMILVR